jgi:hypothetical protein
MKASRIVFSALLMTSASFAVADLRLIDAIKRRDQAVTL